MLYIEIDSRGGILFVRLFGKLTKDTICKFNSEVLCLVSDAGIKNIVLNISHMEYIDNDGINRLKKCYRMCDKSLFCIKMSQVNLIGGYDFITDEYSAFGLIKI